jgi:tetratricopeptide (TPR) repeat protein
MLVTLPFVFLLLDYLPLNRLGSVPVKKIILEKLPMMPLILGASIAAYWAQHVEHVIEQMPPSMHLKNAIVSCAVYLRQTFVPVKLAVFYPHVATLHRDLGVGAVALSGTVIILISVVALLRARREPGLLVGWLWYLGTLVPVIGLVQAGAHAHADRYTYVPLIGVFIAIAWLGAEWAKKWAKVVCAAAVISLAAMCAMTWHQLGYWRNTRTLMQHAIEVVPDNYVAYSNLGEACDAIGEHDNAAELYHKVLALNPDDPLALNNLAVQAVARGDEETAMKLYPRAISSDRTYAPAYNNYGNLLVRRGKLEQAIRVYRAGIKQDREFAPIRHNLALALAQIGRLDEAIDLWRTALEMNPAYADAHESLGNALVLRGQTREGIAELKDALRLQPDRVGALKSLAWIYATHPSPLFQNATEARKLAARAVELKPDDAVAQDTLAAAYARGGRFDEAIDAEERAASLAESQQLQDLVPQIQKRLELYRSHHPFTSGR